MANTGAARRRSCQRRKPVHVPAYTLSGDILKGIRFYTGKYRGNDSARYLRALSLAYYAIINEKYLVYRTGYDCFDQRRITPERSRLLKETVP